MRCGSLFSGIGAFDLAARNIGWETIWFAEWNPFRQSVIENHFPGVPVHGDVRALDFELLEAPDVVLASFPCQDVSVAGKRLGLDYEGSRSGLWREVLRGVRFLRPAFLVMENVVGLRSLGLGDILRDLASIGYDAEWDCIPASAVGAPHERDRIWMVAYPDSFLEHDPGEAVFGPTTTRLLNERRARRIWDEEPRPPVRGMDDGAALRMDRLSCLGDSLVPQVAEAVLGSVEALHQRQTRRKPEGMSNEPDGAVGTLTEDL